MQILFHDYYGQYREFEPAPIQPLSLSVLILDMIIMIIIYLKPSPRELILMECKRFFNA